MDFDIFYYIRNGRRVFNSNVYLDTWWKDKGDLYTYISDATGFLSDKSSMRERIYCLENGIRSVPLCHHCGNETVWCKYRHLYAKFCSRKCVNLGTKVVREAKNTERYGHRNPFASCEPPGLYAVLGFTFIRGISCLLLYKELCRF